MSDHDARALDLLAGQADGDTDFQGRLDFVAFPTCPASSSP